MNGAPEPAEDAALQEVGVPVDEAERLVSLHRLGLLDTPPTPAFDGITRLAAAALRVPVMLVSLVDQNRLWFKSRIGLGVRESPRHGSFCAYAVHQRQTLFVRDAAADPRFANHALVGGPQRIRSYLGIPLYTRDRQPVGTLCAMDTEARDFGDLEVVVLTEFAKIAEELLCSQEVAAKSDSVLQYAMEREKLFRDTFELAAVGIVHTTLHGAILRVNQRACLMLGYTPAELRELSFPALAHPDDLPRNIREFKRALAGEIDSYRVEQRLRCKDQHYASVNLSISLRRTGSRQSDYSIVVIEDISAEKQAGTEALKAAALEGQRLKDQDEALPPSGERPAPASREAQAKLAETEGKLTETQDKLIEAQGKLTETQAKLTETQGKLTEAQGKLTETQGNLTGTQDKLTEAQSKLNQTEARLVEREGELKETQAKLTEEQGRLAETQAKFAETHGKLVDAQEALLAQQASLGETRETLRVTQEALRDAEDQRREAQAALQASNAKLAAESSTDYLTVLPNRRSFSRRSEQAASALRQSRKPYGLILLDLDNFKRINEEYGHEVGDEVLRSLGHILSTQLRNSSDMAARLGGDEFAVLCFGDINEQTLHDVAERIHSQLGKEPLATPKGLLKFTASFGLALSMPDDPDWKTLYTRADAALREAKAAGKDRISFGRSQSKSATARLRALSAPSSAG